MAEQYGPGLVAGATSQPWGIYYVGSEHQQTSPHASQPIRRINILSLLILEEAFLCYNNHMKNIFIIVSAIFILMAGCSIIDPPKDESVAFSIVNASPNQSRSIVYADPSSYEEGDLTSDLIMTYVSQNIELWSTQWVIENDPTVDNPYFNIYSSHLYAQFHQEDPENYPWTWESWFMGPVSSAINTIETYSFESDTTNAVPPVDVLLGPTVYDIMRIPVSEVRYSHNGERINRIWNEVLGDWGYGLFDSIFLIKNIDSPYFIPSTDFELEYDELESKHGEFYARFITENRGNVIMDGAIFIPFEGIDLTEGAEEVVLNIIWDINGSIKADPSGDRFIFNERISGSGVPFDFGIMVNIY